MPTCPPPPLPFSSTRRRSPAGPIAAIAVSPAKAVKLIPLLDRLTLLFATRREAAALLGRSDDRSVPTRELAASLASRGAAHVIVTDSGDPLAAAAGGEVHLFAPFPAHVRSVNGAGDALAAGVLHGLAGGRSFFDAVLTGLAAAAITVEEDGTVAAGLDAAAIENADRKGKDRGMTLVVSPEIQLALAEGRPVVALETTIVSHGMPWPENLETALAVEAMVRDTGAVPAAIAVLDGRIRVGLDRDDSSAWRRRRTSLKLSRADLA